jgi:uncharacterized protein (TIGR00297 family)
MLFHTASTLLNPRRHPEERLLAPAKSITPTRDCLQSRLLVWAVIPILCVMDASRTVSLMLYSPRLHTLVLESVGISLCFAWLAWRSKAATPTAAASGGVICLCLMYGTQAYRTPLAHSALTPLLTLFVLTFLATRSGRERKIASGLAENRSGRTTSQVVANLGFAALFALPLGEILVILDWPRSNAHINSMVIFVCTLSALAEATADTISSEIGQAFGGTPFMLTTLRRVPPGTDGAISIKGTLAGITAAAIIAATGAPALGMSPGECAIAFAAGIAGLFFDSILGATVERKGWLGNDLVNFSSTAFAAAVALLAIHLGQNHLLR